MTGSRTLPMLAGAVVRVPISARGFVFKVSAATTLSAKFGDGERADILPNVAYNFGAETPLVEVESSNAVTVTVHHIDGAFASVT